MAKDKNDKNADGSDGDSWLKKLKFNPASHPDARAFVGYLKPAPDGNDWRLYLSLDLNDYIEIPDRAILDRRSLASPSNPLGGTVVWVEGAETLRRVTVVTRTAPADFLQGEVVQGFLGQSGPSELITFRTKRCGFTELCGVTQPSKPTPCFWCGTFYAGCGGM